MLIGRRKDGVSAFVDSSFFFVFMSVDREQGGAHYYFNIPVVKSVVKMLGGNYSCHLIL